MIHNIHLVCLFSSLKVCLLFPISQPLVQFTFNTFMVVSLFHHNRETVVHINYMPYKGKIKYMLSECKHIMYLDTLMILPWNIKYYL